MQNKNHNHWLTIRSVNPIIIIIIFFKGEIEFRKKQLLLSTIQILVGNTLSSRRQLSTHVSHDSMNPQIVVHHRRVY